MVGGKTLYLVRGYMPHPFDPNCVPHVAQGSNICKSIFFFVFVYIYIYKFFFFVMVGVVVVQSYMEGGAKC
jgi:hypothetical protein